MSSKVHTDPVYKTEKNIKFNLQFNEEQKIANNLIHNNTITLISGKAGSGKTALSVQTGLKLLFNKQYERLIITRPLITAEEEIGFLPGTIKEKTDPYLRPIYDMIGTVYNKASIEKMFIDKTIEIIPFGFMRGINMDNAFVIADEAQNCTISQLKLLMSRLCHNSKLVICGDTDQIDLKNPKDSGFYKMSKLDGIPGYASFELKENHRHPIVELMLNALA